MCGLDYENVFREIRQACKKYEEELGEDFTKAMEGPAGYFREPGGYIVDVRNSEGRPL